jgi:hypothetical protein
MKIDFSSMWNLGGAKAYHALNVKIGMRVFHIYIYENMEQDNCRYEVEKKANHKVVFNNEFKYNEKGKMLEELKDKLDFIKEVL